MYALSIHTGLHSGGTKFYRTVVARGPKSSIHIFQWGPLKGGGTPTTTEAAPSRRESMFHRSPHGAASTASSKRGEKAKPHGSDRGRYNFVLPQEAVFSDLIDMMDHELFQVLCDADKARVLTSLAEPTRAEMEGMECNTLASISGRLRAAGPMSMPTAPDPAPPMDPWGKTPVTPTVAPAPAVNPAEHYGEQWGSW